MLRYHKQVFAPQEDLEKLKEFTERINPLEWKYTIHSFYNIRLRAINFESAVRFIYNTILDHRIIFEWYKEESTGEIIKACYRISWTKESDIILVIGKDKAIVTVFINSAEDKHYTLKKELYTTQ